MYSLTKVKEAKKILDGIIDRTPLLKTNNLVANYNLYIKAENLQYTGAFKLRGAYYKMSQLTKEEKSHGVIAASAGNHAQGVAYAAQKMNIPACIVMPKTAPISKVEATRKYGVEVVLFGNNFDEAYQEARRIQKETNATFIEPFNDIDIICGQGTIALEILEDLPDVDLVIIPIGGGGLAAGIAATIKALKPECLVYGAEAKTAASMYESFQQNKLASLEQCYTIADGISVKTPGDLTYEICKETLDGILLVDDEEISSGVLSIMENLKLVAEGAGAVAVTAALYQSIDLTNKKVVALLSGGNIDVTMISKIIDRGLSKTGRKLSFGTTIPDRPGQLNQLLLLLSDLNANIININHNHSHYLSTPDRCYVEISVETANHSHQYEILRILEEHQYYCIQEKKNELL